MDSFGIEFNSGSWHATFGESGRCSLFGRRGWYHSASFVARWYQWLAVSMIHEIPRTNPRTHREHVVKSSKQHSKSFKNGKFQPTSTNNSFWGQNPKGKSWENLNHPRCQKTPKNSIQKLTALWHPTASRFSLAIRGVPRGGLPAVLPEQDPPQPRPVVTRRIRNWENLVGCERVIYITHHIWSLWLYLRFCTANCHPARILLELAFVLHSFGPSWSPRTVSQGVSMSILPATCEQHYRKWANWS